MPLFAAFLDIIRRCPAPAFAISCAGLTALAWSNRFIQDDAYILMQYASNLVHGQGLIWLPGERVEGYTTFLWTLILAIPIALGIDPVAFAYGAGLVCFAGTLAVAWSLATETTGSRSVALLAIVLLGTNFTFSAYATGGLETQLQAICVTGFFALALPPLAGGRPGAGRLVALSLAGAMALLTRLDSALLIAPPALAVAIALVRGRRPGEAARGLAALTLPALVIVGAWVVWKVGYYGDLLPHTFYIKAGGITSPMRGVRYVWEFLTSYAFLPFALGIVVAAGALAKRIRGCVWMLAAVVMWVAYIIRVGGDFMEYRMFVPILPLMAILAAHMIASLTPRAARVALVAVWLAASTGHALLFRIEMDTESIGMLHGHVADPQQGWVLAGTRLGEEFGPVRDSILAATMAAGAITYHSRLTTLDMYGLMDRWVARNGLVQSSTKPGHQRVATLEYLLRRRVNLVIGHPIIIPRTDEAPALGVADFVPTAGREDLIPPDARLIEIPLRQEYSLTVLYLVRSPAIDALIARRGLRTAPIVRP